MNNYNDFRSILVVVDGTFKHCTILTFFIAHGESITFILNMDTGVIIKRLVRNITIVKLTRLERLHKVCLIVHVYIAGCSPSNRIMVLNNREPIFT